MSLLFHVSDKKVSTLEPHGENGNRPCICFSEDCFISYFGEWVYIFDKEVLEKNFNIANAPSGSFAINYRSRGVMYEFIGEPLSLEYHIFDEIDIDKYCLGVVEQFNYGKGRFTKWFDGMVDNDMRKCSEKLVSMER